MFNSYGWLILISSVTHHKMLLTGSSGHTQKFEFFDRLTKNECAVEMTITKLYKFILLLTQVATLCWCTLQNKAKQIAIIPDRSKGIGKVYA